MRITINIDDQLLKQAKSKATATGKTLGRLIENTLRESFFRHETAEKQGNIRLITMQGTGTRPGVDLDNSQSLLEIMER